MTKLRYLIIKFNSYIPLVVLPVYTYHKLNNIFLAAICITSWRLLTYFRYRFVDKFLQRGINKIIYVAILVLLTFVHRYSETIIVVVVLLSSMLPQYINYDIPNTIAHKRINPLLIISGMVFSGALLYHMDILFYYLILFNLLLIFTEKKKVKEVKQESQKIRITINKFDATSVFLHNFSYYIFAFVIPIVAYKYTEKYYFAGLSCSLSWILFILRVYFTKYLSKIINLRLVIAIGFLLTALLLFWMGKFINISVFFICILIQGASGGISEGFWSLKNIAEDPEPYWIVWKVGGVLGSTLGGFIAISQAEVCLFYIGSILTLFGGLINIYQLITERYGNENISIDEY